MYDINFIHQRIVPASRKKAILSVMSIATLALVLTLAAMGTATLSDLKVAQVYAAQKQGILEVAGEHYQGSPTEDELESIIRKTEPAVEEVGRLVDRRIRMAPVLERIAAAVPEGVWLTRVAAADPRSTDEELRARGKPRSFKGVIVEGVALAGRGPEGDAAVSAFVDSLKRDSELAGYVTEIKPIGTGLDQVAGASVVGFEVTCPFRG
jgi:hypothetical protein